MKSRSVTDLMDMSGSISLVTGASGYIGKEICSSLAEVGSNLVLLDLRLSDLEITKKFLIDTYGVDVIVFPCDLESAASLSDLSVLIENQFGHLDCLVNNAAFVGASNLPGWSVPFQNQSIGTWRRALEVNLTTPFSLVQECLPLLSKSSSASIINIGSIYGFLGPDLFLYQGTTMNNPAAYAASKGGLLQLTRWMATVLSPDIRVNAISPGGVSREQPQDFVDRYVSRTPLKRMGREEDFKGAIVYLASEMSSWVTGQNLIVDGGWSAW